MTREKNKYRDGAPPCFGKLDEVFPLAENGMRASSEVCMVCIYKTDCLRAALSTPEGIRIREEQVVRAERRGLTGFMERWSRKKALARARRLAEKNKKKS